MRSLKATIKNLLTKLNQFKLIVVLFQQIKPESVQTKAISFQQILNNYETP